MNFGDKIKIARKQKGLTVKSFIQLLGIKVSPSYITKIEIHGEIPEPNLIGRIAEVLDLNRNELLEIAKESKIRNFEQTITKKYKQAMEDNHD